MNCRETQKFIHVYLDGEFAEEDRRDFERHLKHCVRCRAMARFEERFKTALRSRVRPVDPPDNLVRNVIARLRTEPAPASNLWKWGSRVVPAGLAAALLLVLLWPRPSPQTVAVSPADTEAEQVDRPAEPDSNVRAYPGPALTPAPVFRSHGTGPIQPAGFAGGPLEVTSGSAPDWASDAVFPTISFPGQRRFRVTALPLGEFPVEGLVPHRVGNVDIYFGARDGGSVAIFRHKGRSYQISAHMDVDELQGLVQTAFSK